MKSIFIVVGLMLLLYHSYADDINRLDSIGLKTGNWIEYRAYPSETIFNYIQQNPQDSSKVVILDKPLMDKPISLIQKGQYINGLKNGIWKEYWPNGSLKNEVTYMNGIPQGYFKIIFTNKNSITGNIIPAKQIEVEIYNDNNDLLEKKNIETAEITKVIFIK